MFRKVFTTTHWKTYLTVVLFLCIFGILWDPPLKVSLLKGWRLKNHFKASCLASRGVFFSWAPRMNCNSVSWNLLGFRVSNIPLVTAKGWLIRYLILRPRGWCLKAHEWDIVCPSVLLRGYMLCSQIVSIWVFPKIGGKPTKSSICS